MLSFIVPAHDEEAAVGATVAAIAAAAAANGAEPEIVVVDDASSDRTGECAAAAGARVVRIEARQIAAARNAGAAAATGSVFVFVDADTLIGAEVVRELLAALARGAVGGGAAIAFDEPVPRWVRRILPFSNWLARRLRISGGCFLFARRPAFEAVGGFDTTLFAAEEISFCKAMRRQGEFRILRAAVLTSGRKLRTYSGREIVRLMFRVGLAGRAGLRDRSRLGIWYGPRRPDTGRRDPG